MATTTTSNGQPVFHRPSSPTKPELRPNPHPYPIKTTSTGVLSRSNSSPHNPQPTRTHYVPPSPSPSPSRTSPRRLPQGQGHKYSKSLSSDFPSPLPIPPSISFPSPKLQDVSKSPQGMTLRHRAETLPSESSVSLPSTPNDAHPPFVSTTLEDLPSNPKTWTPSQLSAYLSTALRVRSGETLPLPRPVANDITRFIRESGITGKMFLRFNGADLEEMGINELWRTALLSSSRSLRQNVLRGRIWGFGSSIQGTTDLEANNTQHRLLDQIEDISPVNDDDGMGAGDNAPFSGDFPSSRSAPALSTIQRLRPAYGNYRNGRVKGMVESFENISGSEESEGGGSNRSRSGSQSSLVDPNDLVPHGDVIEDEPTMGVLLDSGKGSWGARAWEEDVGLGETVKRIVGESGDRNISNANVGSEIPAVEAGYMKDGEQFFVRAGVGEGSTGLVSGSRRNLGGGRAKDKKERRNVSSIFIGLENNDHEADHSRKLTTKDLGRGLKDSAAVRALDELKETRALVDILRQRLEDVEKRVEAMEEWERIVGNEHSGKRLAINEETGVKKNWVSLSAMLRPYTLFSRIIRSFSPSSTGLPSSSSPSSSAAASVHVSDSNVNADSALYRALYPTTLSALPSYVFLISIGMCAVVIRVVIRKALGRRRV